MRRNKDLLIILAVFICAFTAYIIASLPIGVIFGGSDEAAIVAPAMVAEEYGNYTYQDDFNVRYDTWWFQMPGYYRNAEGELYPRGFMGNTYLFTPLYLLAGNAAINVFNSFFGALAAIFIYLIGKLLFQNRVVALTISTIFTLSPFIWIESTYFFPEMVGLATLAMSIYFLMLFKKRGGTRYLVLSALIFSIAVLCRFFNIILIIPMLIYLERDWKHIALVIAVLVIGIIPQFLVNLSTNGNILAFNYFTGDYSPYETSSLDSLFNYVQNTNIGSAVHYFIAEFIIPKSGGEYLWFHLRNLPSQLIKLSPVFYLLPIGLICAFLRKPKLVLLSLLAFSLYFYIFGNMDIYYGMEQLSIRSSYIRYMILPFTLLLILVGYAFKYMLDKLPKYWVIPILAFFVIITPINTMRQPIAKDYYYVYNDSFKHRWSDIRTYILSQTENDAVIFSTFDETMLTGERRLFYYGNIPPERYADELERVTEDLLRDGIPVYVYRPLWYSKWDPVYTENGAIYDFSKNEDIEVTDMHLPVSGYELLKLSLL